MQFCIEKTSGSGVVSGKFAALELFSYIINQLDQITIKPVG